MTSEVSPSSDEVEKAFSGIVNTMASACFDQRAVRKSVSENINTIRAHIAALEADNKRLRDGLSTSVYRLKDMLKADDGQAFKEAEKALPRLEVLLAQPENKEKNGG